MANTQINITANGTKTLKTAGKYCDRDIDVNVNVPSESTGITPTGTKTITTNGTHDVTSYASANVNVPIPSGYIKPSGSLSVDANGTYDVTEKASVVVDVPSGAPTPTQFTNVLKQSTTKFIINQMLSSTAGSYSARKGVVIVEFDFANYVASNRPKFRFRGYTPYSSTVHWSGDGGATWTRVSWYGNYANRSIIDEYGDASIQMTLSSNVANVKFRIDLVCGGPGVPGEDLTSENQVINSGAIMTINEPIGNGGYVG